MGIEGRADPVYGYSFVLTDKLGATADVERHHRERAQVEERIKDHKLGVSLRHLPFSDLEANRVWLHASALALGLLALLSDLLFGADPPGPCRDGARPSSCGACSSACPRASSTTRAGFACACPPAWRRSGRSCAPTRVPAGSRLRRSAPERHRRRAELLSRSPDPENGHERWLAHRRRLSCSHLRRGRHAPLPLTHSRGSEWAT